MFVQGYVTVFCFCIILSVRGAIKAATTNCVPQGIVRARHIPTQTDTVVRFAPEHVVLFLCLYDSVSETRHKATTPNGVPQGKGACDGTISKLALCLVCCSAWY